MPTIVALDQCFSLYRIVIRSVMVKLLSVVVKIRSSLQAKNHFQWRGRNLFNWNLLIQFMYKATHNKIVRVKLTVNQSFKILRQNLASNNHLIHYYGFKKRYA